MIGRRAFLAGSAASAALAARAAAAPILSATNYGLTLAQAQRRNGWIEVDAAADRPRAGLAAVTRHIG